MNTRSLIICIISLFLLKVSCLEAKINPLYTQAKAEKNLDKAIQLYWQYFHEAKGDSSFTDAAYDFAKLLAENDDYGEMITFGDYLSELKPPPASTMNLIAWSLATSKMELQKALTYSKLAVAAQREKINLPPPPNRSLKAWKERNTYRLAYYTDTRGYILLLTSKPRAALNDFLEAKRLVKDENDYELYLHIAQTYDKLNDAQNALEWGIKARYYSGDPKNEDINAVIERNYAKAKVSSTDLKAYLEEKLAELKKREYAELLSNKMNQAAPDFTLKTMDGSSVSLSDYRGHVVLVDFWATWCGPCRRELPLLQKEYPEWKKQGIELLAISTNKDHSKVAPFIRKNQYTFTVLFSDETSKAYDVSGIPTLFVIDPQGIIQYKHVGYRPDIADILNLQIKELTK